MNEGGVIAKNGNATTQAAARDFSLSRLSDNRVAAAIRTPSNGLQIVIWDVDGEGQITELHTTDVTGLPGTTGETIKQVRLSRVVDNKLVAAERRADEEGALRTQWGDGTVEAARAALGWNTNLVTYGATDGYLIEAPTLLEILQAVSSRCLPYALGSYQYSNASPQIMRTVIEHVTGRPYAFEKGYPAHHTNSLYYDFLLSQVGLSTSPVDNTFPHRPGMEGPDDVGPPGPILRTWNGDVDSYYWDAWDRKRPHCDWDGSICTLDNWTAANGGSINWYWDKAEVPAPYYGNTGGTATGGFRAEPQSFLLYGKAAHV